MADTITYGFTCGDFDDDTFDVLRFSGEEEISRLYRFEIDLISDDTSLDVDDLQDQPSTFTIAGGGHEREIQGVASEVEVLDQVADRTRYRVVLVPRLWELTLTRVNAVYLDRTTPEILHGTLAESLGITEIDYGSDLDGQYREWPFRLQYAESHWDFLSRLMERDGIYYYFVAGDGSERIVFCDSAGNQPSIDDPKLPYTASLGMEADSHAQASGTVDSLVMRQRRQPRVVWVQNYNDDKPSTPIREQAEVDPRGSGEVNLYGQNVMDPAEARMIAQIRAEELYCTKAVYHGEGTAFRMSAGHRFELTDHPRPANNREYQILSVQHSGYSPMATGAIGEKPPEGTPVYDNRFTAIPADVQYRAPRETDWPSIRGTLNAEVDAAGDGRFAELDEEGRYHIIFPFQRGLGGHSASEPGKASHWVRMVQPYAGAREGMHFPLRKGARVLIGFIGGNPDLPIITGAVPTAEHASVTGSANQVKSNIKTQNNRIEIDDNEPRIKLQSRKSRSYFHLGCSNAPGDGVTTATDGLSRLCTMGGTHFTVTTYGWAGISDSDEDHPLTATLDGEALESLNTSLSSAVDDDGLDWSEIDDEDEHGLHWPRDEIFAFPVKHDRDSLNDILEEDESDRDSSGNGRHDLMISRTVGVAYEYRLGIEYEFHCPGNEFYEFGPKAEYSSADHDADPLDLRRDAIDLLPDLMEQRGLEELPREDAEKIRDARAELKARERQENSIWRAARHRAKDLIESGVDTLKGSQSGSDDEPSRVAFPFSGGGDDSVNTWLKLHNLKTWEVQLAKHGPSDRGQTEVQPGYRVQELHTDEGCFVLVRNDRSVVGELEAYAEDDPDDDSIAAAREELAEARREHGKGESQIESASFLGNNPAIAGGRIEVEAYDAYRWHFGNIYDFGGCWEYNLGNGYEENHIDQDATLDHAGHDRDLLAIGGPDWVESRDPWSGIMVSEIKNALRNDNQMLVEKTIADTYDYHNGAALEVQVGPSMSVKKGGPNVEIAYSGSNHETEKVISAGGVKKTWRNHRDSGAPLFYSEESWGIVGHGAGKNSFTAEFSPSLSLTVKSSTAFETTLNLDVTTKVSVDTGLALELKFALSGKATIDVSGGVSAEASVFAGAKFSVSKSPLSFKYENGTIDTNIPGLKKYNTPNEIDAKIVNMAKYTFRLSKEGISTRQAKLRIDNAMLKMNS